MPGANYTDDDAGLRRAFDNIRKAPSHGESALRRHSDIRPEWVMRVLADPYDRYEERTSSGEQRTVVVGRVPQSRQWIKLVFIGDPEAGEFLTAYSDRRLARKYGGRPWDIQ